MLEKLVMKGIIFIFIIVSSCHLNHIKKVNNYFQYNIDFRAGFNNDTLSVIFEKSDTLINEELISTSNDGSYFTWKRIRYEYIKGGISRFVYNNDKFINVKKEYNDTLKFTLKINNIERNIEEEILGMKTISISFEKNTNYIYIDRFPSTLGYE
jgi:hypothetical protein